MGKDINIFSHSLFQNWTFCMKMCWEFCDRFEIMRMSFLFQPSAEYVCMWVQLGESQTLNQMQNFSNQMQNVPNRRKLILISPKLCILSTWTVAGKHIELLLQENKIFFPLNLKTRLFYSYIWKNDYFLLKLVFKKLIFTWSHPTF